MTKFYLFIVLFIFTSQSLVAQNGLHFDGTDDYVQTTFSGVLGNNNRTFEAWVYVENTPTSNLAIVDYGQSQVGSRNTFIISGSGGVSYISGGTNANISSPTNIINVGQWMHLAFVLDNGTGYIYLNGTQIMTGNLSNVNTPSGENLKIGQRVSGGSIPFEGIIDEVRVWDVARSQQEIITYMNSDLCGTPSGLVAYYKLNEGVAEGTNTGVTNTIDEVAGADGTLTNFALTGTTSNWVNGQTLNSAFVLNNQTISECEGYSITVGSNTYSTTGNYSDTLFGASTDGCDSIVNTDLTINQPVTYNQTIAACANSTVVVGSSSYTSAGSYIDTIFGGSSAGCDSIIHTDLTFNPEVIANQSIDACAGYSVTVGNSTYTTAGSYTDTLFGASVDGCDSIVNTTLTYQAEISNTQTFDECDGFTITVGSNTYNSTGFYSDTLVGQAATGCDSIVHTDLTISAPIDVALSTNFTTITVGESGATYQWLDCDDNNSAIAGETNQTFTATENGNYSVIVTVGNCMDTSACSAIQTIGLSDIEMNEVSIFPNPTADFLNINLNNSELVNYSLTSFSGQIIIENEFVTTSSITLDLSNLSNGVYFLRVNDKTYRIIKK